MSIDIDINDEEHGFLINAIAEALDELSNEAQRALFFGLHEEDDETGEPYVSLESDGYAFLTDCLITALMRFVRRTEADIAGTEEMDRWVNANRYML